MRGSRIDKAINGLFEWGMFLPLTLASRYKSKLVRVVGIVAFIAWIPTLLVTGAVFMGLFMALMIEEIITASAAGSKKGK